MIELKSVSKNYGDFTAVRDMSFEVARGEIIGLVGPNGAGKTTTMKMITGYLVPTAGSVVVNGVQVADEPSKAQAAIGYLPEHNPIYAEMIVKDYLTFIGKMRGLAGGDLKASLARVVSACQLSDKVNAEVNTLSKGYRQRVGIAQAMIHDPDILILDEPTSGLDPNQIMDIRSLIAELGVDKTVILSTHILPEVEETCSRALMIVSGRLAVDDTLENLAGTNAHRLTVDQSAETVLPKLDALDGVKSAELLSSNKSEHTYLVSPSGGADVRASLFSLAREENWMMTELSSNKRNLEEVFRSVSQGGVQ